MQSVCMLISASSLPIRTMRIGESTLCHRFRAWIVFIISLCFFSSYEYRLLVHITLSFPFDSAESVAVTPIPSDVFLQEELLKENPNALNCGCPITCDSAALAKRTTGFRFSCQARIEYVMRIYNTSQSEACSSAVELNACGADCDPARCSGRNLDEDPPRPHPHAGARDSSGNWNYVEDVSRVRRWIIRRFQQETGQKPGQNTNELPLSYLPLTKVEISEHICNLPLGKGSEFYGSPVLTKVQVDGLKERINVSNPSQAKILCAVYTHEKNHDRLMGIEESWGWHCDGFLAASTITTEEPPFATDVPHLGKENYRNMLQKSRSILAYVHDNYMSRFDYLYLCGDDTHLIVENLRLYLGEVEAKKGKEAPLFAGQLTPGKHFERREPQVIGGGGYVVNRPALEMFVSHANKKECFPTHISPAEDRFISRCFTNIHIQASDAADQVGAQRFHSVDASTVAKHIFRGTKRIEYWNETFNLWEAQGHGRKVGVDIASTSSISFHFLRYAAFMKRQHAILYRSCPANTVLGQQLALIDADSGHENATLSLMV